MAFRNQDWMLDEFNDFHYKHWACSALETSIILFKDLIVILVALKAYS